MCLCVCLFGVCMCVCVCVGGLREIIAFVLQRPYYYYLEFPMYRYHIIHANDINDYFSIITTYKEQCMLCANATNKIFIIRFCLEFAAVK